MLGQVGVRVGGDLFSSLVSISEETLAAIATLEQRPGAITRQSQGPPPSQQRYLQLLNDLGLGLMDERRRSHGKGREADNGEQTSVNLFGARLARQERVELGLVRVWGVWGCDDVRV